MVRSLITAIALAAASSAWAQTGAWPNKPIRLLVPTAAGTPIDAIARSVAQKLQERLGQTFVVDNKAGANQIIGMDACARSAPDGYTFCIANVNSWTINPLIFQKLPYDPEKQLTPVALLVAPATVVAVNAQVGAKNVKEVVELSKRQPELLSWGSTGIGSNSHFVLDAVNEASGWKVTHVPYANVSQLVPALLGNTVQLYYGTVGSVKAHIDSGKLVPLFVPMLQRTRFLPNVPTLKEAGLGDFNLPSWFGMVAPAGTPADIVQKMNEAANAVVNDPAFKTSTLEPQTLDPIGTPLPEVVAYLKRERAASAIMVKKADIKLE